MTRPAPYLFAAALAAFAFMLSVNTTGQAPGLDPSLYGGLHWRMIGPFRGGRVDAVSGVPGRPYEFYFGHVNGGVWKTINAGRTWLPVFDGQPVASIGALAVSSSNPDVVYVGTRRVNAARLERLRQRRLQVDGCRQDVDAHRSRR